MVVYEVISGKLPFNTYSDLAVPLKVIGGERPSRMVGLGFTEDLWKMLEWCWMTQPKDRPNIEGVLRSLELVSSSLESPFLGVDEETKTDGDDLGSENGSSDVSNGTVMTERNTAAPPGLGHSTYRPPGPASTGSGTLVVETISEADVGGPGCEATVLHPLVPTTDLNDEVTHLDLLTVSDIIRGVERPCMGKSCDHSSCWQGRGSGTQGA